MHMSKVILNEERLKAFPLRSAKRQGCPLLPIQYSTVNPGQSHKARKEVKAIRIEKEEVKLSLIDDSMIF